MNVQIYKTKDTDFELFAVWFNDQDNFKWLKSVYRLGRYNRVIHELSLRRKENFFFTVYNENEPVGFVGLSLVDPLDKTAMLWYVLGERSYQGKGVMTKAVYLLLDKAFITLSLRSIYACVAEGNLGSMRVLEKNKFRKIGVQREAHQMEGNFKNRIWFDLLASEFTKLKNG